VADALEELRVFLDEELRPEVAAVLLVAEHNQDQVTRQLQLPTRRTQEGGDVHRDGAFHVDGAAAPHLSVHEVSSEWRSLPLLAGGRDHVDVALQQERRAVACASKPGAEVRPIRLLGIGLRLAARLFQQVPDEADALGFVPRRVRRVESDQLLEELDWCH